MYVVFLELMSLTQGLVYLSQDPPLLGAVVLCMCLCLILGRVLWTNYKLKQEISRSEGHIKAAEANLKADFVKQEYDLKEKNAQLVAEVDKLNFVACQFENQLKAAHEALHNATTDRMSMEAMVETLGILKGLDGPSANAALRFAEGVNGRVVDQVNKGFDRMELLLNKVQSQTVQTHMEAMKANMQSHQQMTDKVFSLQEKHAEVLHDQNQSHSAAMLDAQRGHAQAQKDSIMAVSSAAQNASLAGAHGTLQYIQSSLQAGGSQGGPVKFAFPKQQALGNGLGSPLLP